MDLNKSSSRNIRSWYEGIELQNIVLHLSLKILILKMNHLKKQNPIEDYTKSYSLFGRVKSRD